MMKTGGDGSSHPNGGLAGENKFCDERCTAIQKDNRMTIGQTQPKYVFVRTRVDLPVRYPGRAKEQAARAECWQSRTGFARQESQSRKLSTS